jgi:hypothetical protein
VINVKLLLELLVVESSDWAAFLMLLVRIYLLNHDAVYFLELGMRFQKVPLWNFHRFRMTQFSDQLLPHLRPGKLQFFHSLVVIFLIQLLIALKQQLILLAVSSGR